MKAEQWIRRLSLAAVLCTGLPAFAQIQHLPMEPLHDAGQSITGALEGWFKNPDGTFSILVGYYNRNLKEVIDIPVGPNNRIEPGGPDRGQPTHFLAGRQWGLFAITVPKDFGNNKLTWTIVANGKPTSIPLSIDPLWEVAPFIDATRNTPPYLSFKPFEAAGPTIQGPLPLSESFTTAVGTPLTLDAWVADDNVIGPGRRAPAVAVNVTWAVMRGSGKVTFAPEKPPVEKSTGKLPGNATFGGKTTTTATFSEPGDYKLYLMVNDASGVGGGGGFQCCWTNGHVNVTVKAK